MKLWNELTEEEQKELVKFCEEIAKILFDGVIEPLLDLIEDLSFFFIAMEHELRYNECPKKKKQEGKTKRIDPKT